MKLRPSSGVIVPAFIEAVTHDLDIAHQFLCVELYIVQNLVDTFALDDLFDFITVFVDADMHGICVAEKIVHVAKYFLICSHEEYTQIV